MKPDAADNKTKTIIAIGCIVASLIGLALGITLPKPIADTFSLGTLISLIAYLVSLGSVKDRGSNLPAILAYFISFLTMSISIFCSGMTR